MTAKKTICEPISVFAISDFHLPGNTDKPMDIFGSHWEGHFERIKSDWLAKVGEEDIVLIPGDISWAMTLDAAQDDLDAISLLPGRKIIVRGNHDFWWGSISQVRARLPKSIYALQNDAAHIGGLVFCGSRGWTSPANESDLENAKIYQRELIRLEMSLQHGMKLGERKKRVALLHFPPFDAQGGETQVTRILEKYQVSFAVYGHIHGMGTKSARNGELNGIGYQLVSCDALDFTLFKLPVTGE